MNGTRIVVGAVSALLGLAAGGTQAHADSMMMPHDRGVELFEPRQQAIVAWNGSEEILILSVTARASRATEVLQVVPFPAEPAVSKGDAHAFERAVKLVNAHQLLLAAPASTSRKPSMSAPAAGEVTMRQVIGLHDVAVVRVLSADGFAEWVRTTMGNFGVAQYDISPQAMAVIADYVAGGFEWFVFDQLSLPDEFVQTEPLEYRFKTPRLYYPLKITRVSDESNAELVVLTKQPLRHFTGIAGHRVRRLHPPVIASRSQIARIDSDLARLFGPNAPVCLRLWRISETDGRFSEDLLVQ